MLLLLTHDNSSGTAKHKERKHTHKCEWRIDTSYPSVTLSQLLYLASSKRTLFYSGIAHCSQSHTHLPRHPDQPYHNVYIYFSLKLTKHDCERSCFNQVLHFTARSRSNSSSETSRVPRDPHSDRRENEWVWERMALMGSREGI